MTGYSNGNSFGVSAASVLDGAGEDPALRWPVPPWKFGLRQSDDRGCI